MAGPSEDALVTFVEAEMAADLAANGFSTCQEITDAILAQPGGQIRKMLDDWVREKLPEWLLTRTQEVMEQYANNQGNIVDVGDCRYEPVT